MRTAIALILALVPSLAFGQGAIRQNGPSTKYDMLGFIQDHQAEAVSKLFTDNARGANPIHIFDAGGIGVCTEDALTTGPYHQFCLGHDSSGNPVLNATAFNGASIGSPQVNFNGTLYSLIGLGGGNMTGPLTSVPNEVALFNSTTGGITKGTAGDIQYTPSVGLTLGYGPNQNSLNAPTKLQAQTIYTGTVTTPFAGFFHLDDKASNGHATNPNGLYGDLWYDSPTTFDGLGVAIRGNAYTIPQLTATIAIPGSGYTNGDVVSITGGDCASHLNFAPTFQLTVSGGVVTGATDSGAGACITYPGNPVSVSGGTGTGLQLTVANNAGMQVNFLAGTYGRARHTALGTVVDAVSLFADGCYNAGGGTLTNCIGVWLQNPYDSNQTNAYGIWQAGQFAGGTIGSANGQDILFNPGGGTNNTNSTGPIQASTTQACQARMQGGSNGQVSSLGTNCFLFLNAQSGGMVELTVNNIPGLLVTAPPSGVNYIQISGNTTAFSPAVQSAGSDTNVDLDLFPKGSGVVLFGNSTSFSVNGAVAMSLGSTGPTGATSTPGKWVKIKDSAGAIYVLPAYSCATC